MERRPISADPSAFPEAFRDLIASSRVYDSSCSPQAQVWFLDREEGMFLKAAPKGSLRREAKMTALPRIMVRQSRNAAIRVNFFSLITLFLLCGF